MPDISFERLLVDNLSLIDRISGVVARRQGMNADEHADFTAWVRLRLVEDDYAILRKFRGDSALGTYLTVVIAMLARDHRIQQEGKWRPSAAALRRGDLAVRLETLVYRKGYRLVEAAELLRTSGKTTLSHRELAELLAELPVRAPLRLVKDAAEPSEELPAEGSADLVVVDQEREKVRVRIFDAIRQWMLALPAEERLMLHLRFWEGLSTADIARGLQLQQKPLYRTMERLLARLRTTLLADGLTSQQLDDVMDGGSGMTPDANEIAALLDGTLAPEHRARVIAAIDASEELREVFADAILATREIESAPGFATPSMMSPLRVAASTAGGPRVAPANVSPLSRRWTLAGLAAAATLLIATGLLLRRGTQPAIELGSPASTVAMLADAEHAEVPPPALGVMRGDGGAASTDAARAIRLGAAIARAELQLLTGDSLVRVSLDEAARTLEQLPVTATVAREFRTVANRSMKRDSRDALSRASDDAARFVDAPALRVGAWLVVLRAAASRNDTAFVRAPSTDAALRVLRVLAEAQPAETRGEAEQSVGALGGLIAAPAIDWTQLDGQAASLLRILGR